MNYDDLMPIINKNTTSKQLSDISHDFIGWIDTKDGKMIDPKYVDKLNI